MSARKYAHCAGCGVWVADPRPKPGEDPEKLYCRSPACYPEPVPDPYSFRPPQGSHAMRANVAEAIGAAEHEGVERVVADVRHADVVYLVCSRSAWFSLTAKAARYNGNQRKGDRRRALFD